MIKNKKAIESIFTTFILIIVLVVVAIMFTYIGYTAMAIKNVVTENSQKFSIAENSKDVILNCLNKNSRDPLGIEDCLPTGFVGGYLKGFAFEESYGPGPCNNTYTYGEESSNVIIYWVNTYNEDECLSRLKLMI